MESVASFQMTTKPERSERIENLYRYITSFRYGICVERGKLLTEFYSRNMNLPAIVRRARAIDHVLSNMTVYIMPDSLFAGNQASCPRWAPLFPEFDVEWIEQEILKGQPFHPWDRPADQYAIAPGGTEEVEHICAWWRGRTHTDNLRVRLPEEALHTHFDIKAADIGAYFQGGDGHYSPHHEWLINHGVQQIIDDCERLKAGIDWSQPDAVQKREFYEAALISANALIKYAARYALLARDMAEKEQNPGRRQELLEIAQMCERVPRYPARTFKEALQFIILVHIAIQIEDNGAGISFGRYDQFMYPFYLRDLKAGILSRELALEYTENFFLQIYACNKVRSWGDTDFFRGVPMFQNLTIGGQDPVKKCDATNELSYICLDATANTRVPQPSLTVRFHRKTPFEFKMRVAEVVRLGLGLPSIFNDEAYIPAMINRGYELDDAYNYCIIGCVEPGTSGLLGGRTGGAWLNCPKALEMALYGGLDPRTGLCLQKNPSGRDLSSFVSFEDCLDAYKEQMAYYVKMEAILENTIDKVWEETLEEPMAAIFGCPITTVPRGKPLKQGGAKYDLTGQQTIGTANIANSLCAIKELVFDRKLITGAQLLHALRTDFSDMTTAPTGPQIQAMCLNAPKYGNDIDQVDELARDMLSFVALELSKYKNTRYGRGPIGCVLHCSTSTVSSNTPFGKVCGATPDGRKAGAALADGQSPMRGTDVCGPTASIASVSKLNSVLLSCGSLYNLKFNPADLC